MNNCVQSSSGPRSSYLLSINFYVENTLRQLIAFLSRIIIILFIKLSYFSVISVQTNI